MDSRTLKSEIIEWISNTDDISLLNILKALKDPSAGTAGDWYNELSDEEAASIRRGIENHENGEVLTSEEFWSDHGE